MGVADHGKNAFLELKRKQVHRYMIIKIDENKKEVVVEKTGNPAESFDDFTASLAENDCRYAMYDFDFVTSENFQKSKIFFVHCEHASDALGQSVDLISFTIYGSHGFVLSSMNMFWFHESLVNRTLLIFSLKRLPLRPYIGDF
ncbi:Actin-depolymerizing factor 6 [Capsicum annuum]|uniref:Actin-depolymerizing factor 6 n=1 Tax=Capsicum annuum TaxID=4072 RepID=A0A2G2ZXP0_CAPAN|nr:Actin-depolymerizing factor 6 [Capsicum annuum]